jgi:hypothetical protein
MCDGMLGTAQLPRQQDSYVSEAYAKALASPIQADTARELQAPPANHTACCMACLTISRLLRQHNLPEHCKDMPRRNT